jgi:hypothetical protein
LKCRVCKYKNAALEAQRHPNGTTIFFAEALRKKAIDGMACPDHMLTDVRGKDMAEADKALANAFMADYIPLEHLWSNPVWVPKENRQ